MMTKESSKITMNIKAENATNSDWQGYQISPVLCSRRGNRIIVLKFRPDENYENQIEIYSMEVLELWENFIQIFKEK